MIAKFRAATAIIGMRVFPARRRRLSVSPDPRPVVPIEPGFLPEVSSGGIIF